MGFAKAINKGNGKVVFVHQLNNDGSAYGENVTVEVQEGVDESRLAWLAAQDGKIGVISYSFSASDPQPEGLKFPEEED